MTVTTTSGSAATSSREHELLRSAERAYKAGDVARMRKLCTQLIASVDRELAARAGVMMARVTVDPLAFGVLAAALVLFGVIVHAYMF